MYSKESQRLESMFEKSKSDSKAKENEAINIQSEIQVK